MSQTHGLQSSIFVNCVVEAAVCIYILLESGKRVAPLLFNTPAIRFLLIA